MLSNQVHGHVPLTTITNGVAKHKMKRPIINGRTGPFNDGLQEMVGSLKLVPKVNMRLTKLKLLHIELLHRAHSKEIQRCKEPASPAAFLIRH